MSELPPEDVFLTVAEIAEQLTVSQQTVRNWIGRERLPATRVGRRIRIRQRDLERFIIAGATRPVRPPRRAAAKAENRKQARLAPTAFEAQKRFLEAAIELVRLLVESRSGNLASALRVLAQSAERWAETLD